MAKVVGLIPSYLACSRFPGKALADISGMPLVVHTVKRSQLSDQLNRVIVCTDSKDIAVTCDNYDIECLVTEGEFLNGTERIASVSKSIDFDFAIDIYGDEPLIDPLHIDSVAKCIVANRRCEDIVIPTLNVPYSSPDTIIRVQASLSGKVMTLSRGNIPYQYAKPCQFVQKHLSIIGFTKKALLKYANLPPSPNEQSESIELLRAIENDMNVFSLPLSGFPGSVHLEDDLLRVRVALQSDRYFGEY